MPSKPSAWLRLVGVALLAALLIGPLGSQESSPRFHRLGEQMICTCGCNQPLLTCNHLGCTTVTQMRAELAQRVSSKDSDNLILQAFIQEYGSQVIANPSKHGFNLVGWVMPWVAALAGLILVLYFVRFWSRRQPSADTAGAAAAPPASDEALERVRREVDAELRDL